MRTATFKPSLWTVLGGALAVALLPLLVTGRYNTNVLLLAGAWAIAALGLTVVLGYAGQISLAQASFFGIGAYAIGLGTVHYGLNWWLAFVLGLVVAVAGGIILGSTTLKLGGHYLAMVTIGFQIIFTLVMTNWSAFSGGPDGITRIPRPPFFVPLNTAQRYAWFALAATFLAALAVHALRDSRLGRSMRAVRENEIAAEALGVDAVRVKVTAFAISALLGAVGGSIYASGFLYIAPDTFDFGTSVQFLAMVLVGGRESVAGSVLGAGLLTFLPEWLRELKKIYLVVYGSIIVLVIVFMPEGLWGFVTFLSRSLVRPTPHLATRGSLSIGTARLAGEPVLVIENLGKYFGGLKAVDGVSFAVRQGEVHALIGPNGSGKTTILNVISGLYVPSFGEITFLGQSIGGQRGSRIARWGMTRTFQNLRLFRELTVWENVLVGAQRAGGDETAIRERAASAIEFMSLTPRVHTRAKNLPYGMQKRVEIARALAGAPELLLLDEPAAGLTQSEKQDLVEIVQQLHERGLTMLLVEHDMSLVSQLSHHITVI
ncbi:MAG TPA: branched-chain amino acid ABC transporter ATP-binding protein/permease, partial [bacterium]|nr:branched-chain amino acid ABC transporter ATP-binding protein/permease [bacterium]